MRQKAAGVRSDNTTRINHSLLTPNLGDSADRPVSRAGRRSGPSGIIGPPGAAVNEKAPPGSVARPGGALSLPCLAGPPGRAERDRRGVVGVALASILTRLAEACRHSCFFKSAGL